MLVMRKPLSLFWRRAPQKRKTTDIKITPYWDKEVLVENRRMIRNALLCAARPAIRSRNEVSYITIGSLLSPPSAP